jgi:hypothetical protein
MSARVQAASREAVERLHTAMNQHDLEAFLACFDPHYRSEQPRSSNPRLRRSRAGREEPGRRCSRAYPTSTRSCSPLRRRVTLSGPSGIGQAPEQMKRRSTCEE